MNYPNYTCQIMSLLMVDIQEKTLKLVCCHRPKNSSFPNLSEFHPIICSVRMCSACYLLREAESLAGSLVLPLEFHLHNILIHVRAHQHTHWQNIDRDSLEWLLYLWD